MDQTPFEILARDESVTRRTQEIGIRRAAGADAGRICLQFVGEILALTTVAVLLGVLLIFHSALFDLFPSVTAWVYTCGLLMAAAILYLLVTAAALYPGWMAARVQPAEALHYE